MKLSAFNNSIMDRLELIRMSMWYLFQKETAYWANNWASMFSTTFYTVAMLVFINVLYANVRTIVGYDKNDMLFFFLIGQMSYYVMWCFSYQNFLDFILDVNRGDLDLILTKPVPTLFYISTRHMSVFSIVRDAMPPTLAIIFSINWSVFNFRFENIIISILIFILGQLTMNFLLFLGSIPVIWLGESKRILNLFNEFEGNVNRTIPLEGFTAPMRVAFGMIFPIILTTSITTSVLLNKSDPYFYLLWTIVATVFTFVIRNLVWKKALRSYTSASS